MKEECPSALQLSALGVASLAQCRTLWAQIFRVLSAKNQSATKGSQYYPRKDLDIPGTFYTTFGHEYHQNHSKRLTYM